MAREIRPKDVNEQSSPGEVKPIVQSKVKCESPVPLQDLESNINEVKCNKGCKEGEAVGKENTTTNGREAEITMQRR